MWAPWKPQGGDWTPGAAPMKAQPTEKLKDTLVTGSASSARPFLFKRASHCRGQLRRLEAGGSRVGSSEAHPSAVICPQWNAPVTRRGSF